MGNLLLEGSGHTLLGEGLVRIFAKVRLQHGHRLTAKCIRLIIERVGKYPTFNYIHPFSLNAS